MTDKSPRGGTGPFDPTAALQSLLPGLTWTQSMLDQTGRAQAALAAETLSKLNAPVTDALERQREFAATLAATAKQMAAMATQLEGLARQNSELTERLQSSLGPYLRYVDWLRQLGAGGPEAGGKGT
jgi:broad specificity phosphatase PhoE